MTPPPLHLDLLQLNDHFAQLHFADTNRMILRERREEVARQLKKGVVIARKRKEMMGEVRP